MTIALMQIWEVLRPWENLLKAIAILIVCPILGGLPLIAWITQTLTGRRLAELGTGNISVSAAFYHGGRWVGILAVLSEAFKGIIAVLLARSLFPDTPAWELIALIALVIGRYGFSKGAGTTNVVWGVVVHDPVTAGLICLIGAVGFTILRERKFGRIFVLVLLPLITILRHPYDSGRAIAAMFLSVLLAWIYQNIPDDLDLSPEQGKEENKAVFRFFRGERAILSLDSPLKADQVGEKAATLSQLKRWGYAVPPGWVLPPGDDPEPLIELLQPSVQNPLIVRSSAIGEDSQLASAAGQYQSIADITDRESLRQAIIRCQNSYNRPAAVQYRHHRNLPELAMSVLIQQQVRGTFSGVAFSRDPISQQGEEVLVEALPGDASRVVSGHFTPERYCIEVDADDRTAILAAEGAGEVPPDLIEAVARIARELEKRDRGIPQDVEWTYDGEQLWILQSRPIVTGLPIWTRKIAAEVIPGTIRPLTWSINRPLTCGVWGEIFTIVLGKRVKDLDFDRTATLHYSRAYFNATLLGEIFLRMGLPPESLEFLTRGAKFSKPPLSATLRQLPGLLRLLSREWQLEQDFERDDKEQFSPLLSQLQDRPASPDLTPVQLLDRIEKLLTVLKRATYYSILTPLSFAFRQAVLKVKDSELDSRQTPEVAALERLNEIAIATRHLLPDLDTLTPQTIFGALSEVPDGQNVLEQFDRFLEQYGYLSQVATDIAIPRWKEDPRPVRSQFAQLIGRPHPLKISETPSQSVKVQVVQSRLNLKGKVAEVYSQLLAELRWSFVALEQIWLESELLQESGEIFLLKFKEIQQFIPEPNPEFREKLPQLLKTRQLKFKQDLKLPHIPFVVYGNAPAAELFTPVQVASSSTLMRGIGASPGQAEGEVQILQNLEDIPEINRNTILVVPYTDAGWSPVLARAGGLIAEVGGRLSHGAIVAREYGIPAVMDVRNATQRLQVGQRVRIDGAMGTVEIL